MDPSGPGGLEPSVMASAPSAAIWVFCTSLDTHRRKRRWRSLGIPMSSCGRGARAGGARQARRAAPGQLCTSGPPADHHLGADPRTHQVRIQDLREVAHAVHADRLQRRPEAAQADRLEPLGRRLPPPPHRLGLLRQEALRGEEAPLLDRRHHQRVEVRDEHFAEVRRVLLRGHGRTGMGALVSDLPAPPRHAKRRRGSLSLLARGSGRGDATRLQEGKRARASQPRPVAARRAWA